MTFRIEPRANDRLDAIYEYSLERWGARQADLYVTEMFEEFGRIARREAIWQPLPVEFGLDGYRRRWRHHMIYWKVLADGKVGIVSILHERMDQVGRMREDFE